MAKKYTKFTSNFIISEKYKNTEKGLISLRDWTTIGEVERLERGKKPLYGNGNFLFTVNNVVTNPTRHKVSKFVGTFTYDDVKNAQAQNNLTELNLYTNDLRDFAYYGSATELINSTIQHIIQTFPARITLKNERIVGICEFKDVDGNSLSETVIAQKDISDEENVFTLKKELESNAPYILNNPFMIDLHHENIKLGEYDVPYRYLTYYFKNFQISTDGINYFPIISYSVNLYYNNINKECDYDRERFNCVFDKSQIAEITINDNIKIKGYLFDGAIKWGYEGNNLYIEPNKDVIENYFSNLNGVEKILLRRDTKPLYFTRLTTPVINDDVIQLVDRGYCFPSQDGFIDIEGADFTRYVNELYDMCAIWDSSYCDNLYQRMTHESIKNYDWTFTKDYNNGDEEEFIDGGVRIEKLLRIYGRVFDDIKHYIDGIKYTIQNTYDAYRNMPSAQLTDNLENNGWHIVSTIPTFTLMTEDDEEKGVEYSESYVTDEFLTEHQYRWFNNKNNNLFNFTQCNTNFMKRLLCSSSYICRSKGTKRGIEMIFGMFGFGSDMDDYSISEEYYTTQPKDADETDKDGKTLSDAFYDLIGCFSNAPTEGDLSTDYPIAHKVFKTKNENGMIIEHTCMIPFLTNRSMLNDQLYFQSKGGWCKYSNDGNKQDYLETVSYLNIKYNINELFNLAPINVKEGDIYYIVNIKEFKTVFGTDVEPKSRFFVAVDTNQLYSAKGWKNVGLYDTEYGERIRHLDNIVTTNMGNNPHVGYGRYDMGESYKTYINNPFSYAKDNYSTSYGDGETYMSETQRNVDIDRFNFNLKTKDTQEGEKKDKIFIVNKYGDNDGGLGYYYLNSKVVKITNKRDNQLYKDYFKEVILPYILQVVPSTTILILIDF